MRLQRGMEDWGTNHDRFTTSSRLFPFRWFVGFTTGIPRVQFSDTVPLPVNTVTVAGEGMTPYMFRYGVIPKNIKMLHCPSLHQPHGVAGCVLAGSR